MADSPPNLAQEAGNAWRAPPPAFVAQVGNPFASPPAPVTPPPPPQHLRQLPSSAGGSTDGKDKVTLVRAESDASPAETQGSSNQVTANGATRERVSVEQMSDGKSAPAGGVSNGWSSYPHGGQQAIPMGPPTSGYTHSGQFSGPAQFAGPPGPPSFASPLRPLPSFNAQSSPGRSSFSEIPLAQGTPPSGTASANGGGADHTLYSGIAEEEHEPSGYSASSTNFLRFSAQTILKNKKLANTASLGFGALVTPGKEVSPTPPVVWRNGLRCQNCGAYSNVFCGVVPSSGHWRCSLCNKHNSSEGEYRSASSENIRNWPELVTSVVDYIDVGNRRPGFVSVADSAMTAPVIVIVDETLDEAHLQHLQSSLHSFLDSLSPATRIGIVTFGKTVSVYDLSESGVAAADILPGDVSPSPDLLKMLIYGTGVYLAPIHACLSIAQTIVSSLRPYRGDLPELGRDRCLGTAVEVALALIQGPSTELPRSTVKRSGGSSRIIISVSGPNTVGIGSLPYSQNHPNFAYLERKAITQMGHLGHEARRLDTAVDVLVAGTCPVRIPTLQPLAKVSGGVLVLHDDFGEAFGSNMQRAMKRSQGFRAILEMRTSKEIKVTRVIGPGEESSLDSSEFRKDTSTAVQMLSVEDSQGFAVGLEIVENVTGDFVYFQFVARFTSVHQANVIRVITVRLPTTNSPTTYLQSVDDEVTAVLIAKRIMLLAEKASDLPDMLASVDERMKDIAVKFGSQMPKTKIWRFPKEISRLPELLFHLKRGPLLGRIVGHEDERAVYRHLFLQASFDLSLRMLAPRLLMHQDGGTFEELPAYDVAMQSDASLVLDHGTDLFIWMGLEVLADEGKSAAAVAACRTLAHELTEDRFPAPRLLAFKEASSQARYLQCRLIPTHKDPPYEQEARFPQLRTLRQDQRARLKNSFFHTDDLSFLEYMRSLKLVPPEPS